MLDYFEGYIILMSIASFAEKDLKQIFQDMNLKENSPKTGKVQVSVMHLPALSVSPMLDGKLILSAAATDLFPAPIHCVDPDSMHLYADGLPDHWRENIVMNAAAVSTILASAGVTPGKAHFWSLGSSAAYLAHVLSSIEQPQIENCGDFQEAAVVIVDRVCILFGI